MPNLTLTLALTLIRTLPRTLTFRPVGGGTAVRCAQLEPTLFTGMVLYAPMLSLELAREMEIGCGFKNAALVRLFVRSVLCMYYVRACASCGVCACMWVERTLLSISTRAHAYACPHPCTGAICWKLVCACATNPQPHPGSHLFSNVVVCDHALESFRHRAVFGGCRLRHGGR